MNNYDELRVIECSGTAYEIGFQYGKTSKGNIHKALDILISGLQQNPRKLPVNRRCLPPYPRLP